MIEGTSFLSTDVPFQTAFSIGLPSIFYFNGLRLLQFHPFLLEILFHFSLYCDVSLYPTSTHRSVRVLFSYPPYNHLLLFNCKAMDVLRCYISSKVVRTSLSLNFI